MLNQALKANKFDITFIYQVYRDISIEGLIFIDDIEWMNYLKH